MAILNYGNQFKYSGKGYLDSKITPVKSVDDLEKSKSILSAQYQPGMKVTVLNDGDFGAVDYFLNENYEWKRVINLENLTLSLDKGNYDKDENEEMYLQIHYTNANGDLVVLGNPVDLSEILVDVEKRLDVLENNGIVEDTDTFISNVDIVTNNEDVNGLFIKFTYNNGEKFYLDITELQPKAYSAGVGILIGADNVVSIDEAWFEAWFDGKVVELNDRLAAMEEELQNVKTNVSTLSDSLNMINGKVVDNENAIKTLTSNLVEPLKQIANNKLQIEQVKVTADTAAAKADENENKISTLSEQLAKIRGVEYVKAGNNIEVVDNGEYVTISATVPSVDTTEIENRLDVAESKIEEHTSDIASLQEAVKNLTPDGEGLSGDNVTIKANEAGALSVMISSNENNILQSKNNGLFVQGIEIILGDEEINAEE